MDKRIAKLLIAENQRMIQNVEMVKRNISFESHSNYVPVSYTHLTLPTTLHV